MENWFKESEVFFDNYDDKHLLGSRIIKYPSELNKEKPVVALLGIDETTSDSIRRQLYITAYSFTQFTLVDLGNVRNTNSEFIIPILNELNSNDVNIILLGSNRSHFDSQINAFNNKIFNIAFIEKSGNILFDKKVTKSLSKSNNIEKAKLIAYQSHLLNPSKLEREKLNHSMRLGQLRGDHKEIEPILRDVDLAMFNLDSIRYSEVPGIKNTSPSGLTSEEACQILKYIGLNSKTNIIDIIGYDPKYDFHNQGAMLVSQLLWYYLDGIDKKVYDDYSNGRAMTHFVVDLNDYSLSLEFIQSKKTGRWWVGIPETEDKKAFFLPCSEDDFEKAKNNEISRRIFNELSI